MQTIFIYRIILKVVFCHFATELNASPADHTDANKNVHALKHAITAKCQGHAIFIHYKLFVLYIQLEYYMF